MLCCVNKFHYKKTKKKLFSGKLGIVEIIEERSIDIDTMGF